MESCMEYKIDSNHHTFTRSFDNIFRTFSHISTFEKISLGNISHRSIATRSAINRNSLLRSVFEKIWVDDTFRLYLQKSLLIDIRVVGFPVIQKLLCCLFDFMKTRMSVLQLFDNQKRMLKRMKAQQCKTIHPHIQQQKNMELLKILDILVSLYL